MSKLMRYRDEWEADATYYRGQVVLHDNDAYVAVSSSSGVTPGSDEAMWEPLGGGGGGAVSSVNGRTGAVTGLAEDDDVRLDHTLHQAIGPDGIVDQPLLNQTNSYHLIMSVGEVFEAVDRNYNEGLAISCQVDPSASSAVETGGMEIAVESVEGNDKDMGRLFGDYVLAIHRAAGDLTEMVAVQGFAQQRSAGNVQWIGAGYLGVQVHGTGSVEQTYGLYVFATSDVHGSVAENYGLYIEDQSGAGSDVALNIYSAGAGTKNRFDGDLDVGGHFGCNGAAPAAPPTLSAAATDEASAIILVNEIRSALIQAGLATG